MIVMTTINKLQPLYIQHIIRLFNTAVINGSSTVCSWAVSYPRITKRTKRKQASSVICCAYDVARIAGC